VIVCTVQERNIRKVEAVEEDKKQSLTGQESLALYLTLKVLSSD